MRPAVSVVVPTHRRPELLDRCLAALAAQDLQGACYEVIVADNAPSDDTRAVVERWARRARTPITYLPANGTPGPAAARNHGWKAARAPIVAFTDDDCIPDPSWLSAGLAAFTDGVAAVEGRVRVPSNGHRPTDWERNTSHLETSEFVTASCFYRRTALAAVGGFDERFRLAWREDSDLYFSLVERGLRTERAPAAVVEHPARPARWGVSLREQRKNELNALLYKKHPRLYRERVQAGPPLRYYATVAAGALAVAAGFSGRRGTANVAGLAWAALTARFAAQRLAHTSRAPTHVAEMVVTSALIPPLAVFWRLCGAVRHRVLFF